MVNIMIFGDSIVFGGWDDELGGWANRLKIFCMKHNDEHNVFNLGIVGDRSEWLLERFKFEAEQRLSEEENIIIFAIGMNDSYAIKPEKFEENIKKLIKLSRKFTRRILFVGLINVIEKVTNPVPWCRDAFYKNKNIEQFDGVLRDICIKHKLSFIEVYNLFGKDDFYLPDDGLHPNPKGHEKIFNLVKDFLIKNKWI
ncbi:MAG TPA: hypothetical protein ENG87_02920 [Candidatus Pacearchaeota archaeon]|nr:GDSL-like Lipase/Acylhydrolase [archaeon BMS3Abin17]HDK42305.1 hypothetical protein [Candidatus Pacearchaeota archaeon]HDZ60666.1 hypothetical protein [Candidatus Pacearchaeota archaeon]